MVIVVTICYQVTETSQALLLVSLHKMQGCRNRRRGQMFPLPILSHTDYGRLVGKSPSLHSGKSTPTPKFWGAAKAYFVCHIGPSFQISLIYAFHGLRTHGVEIAFNARPKIHSHTQIFRYGGSIFCLPHRPKFSDIFDLCLHWVSVVRAKDNPNSSKSNADGLTVKVT